MDLRERRTLIFSLISLLGVVLIVIFGYFIFIKNDMKLYEDPKKGFSIKYPKTWSVFKQFGHGVAVIFNSPKDSELDSFMENVSITVQRLPESTTLEEYTQLAIKQMNAVFKQSIETVESDSIRMAGHSGHKFVYKGYTEMGEENLKIMQCWILIDGTLAYQFSYGAHPLGYDRHLSTAKKMLRSFKVHK